ncbi:hypothetical protein, partial [Rummeliibacillus sp. POC4]|uniref:hypothetical protein n=1 Tax=Rummeliibacillus sp. POC4 TaxID=2305899 RepID=UPI001F3D7983
ANGSWGLSPCESRSLLGTLKAQLFIQLRFFYTKYYWNIIYKQTFKKDDEIFFMCCRENIKRILL